ncbi:Cytochrome c oxidase polypeptide II [Sphingomonas paucimobilis]|nr:Cytochrome c oxidase polypeptide II [Sphingomonas paucimobilis]
MRIGITLILLLGGCKPPPEGRAAMPGADVQRGRALVQRTGCAACHLIPGIRWPQGRLGPDLTHFARQGMIAGRVPNRPDMLTAFVRNAPALVSGMTMPAMPLDQEEARDVAAYLYTLD